MSEFSEKNKMKSCLQFVLFLLIIGTLAFLFLLGYKYKNRFRADDIVNNSVLQNRKFIGHVQEIKSDNITAWFMEEHSNPIVSVSFSFRHSGSAYEPEDKQGLTNVLADMLLNGTKSYNAIKFKDLCDEYGIKINFSASKDDFIGSLIFPKAHMRKAVDLFREVINSPRFDEQYLNLSKQQLSTSLQIYDEHPQNILQTEFAEIVFGGHPYSRHRIGKKDNIAALSADDLRDYLNKYLTKNNLLVGVTGDLSENEAQTLINELFARLPEQYHQGSLPKLEIASMGENFNIKHFSSQAITYFVTQGTYRNSLDFYPLYVANYIFGEAGLNSRINKNIREKEGLTYGAYTGLQINDSSALIVGSFSTTADNFDKAKSILIAEWKSMAASGITANELLQAKQFLISSYNLRFADIDGISEMLVAMQKYDLGQDFLEKRNNYIRSVTLKEVNAAAKKYFSNDPDFISIGVESKEKQ